MDAPRLEPVPFSPADRPLRDILLHDFLMPVTEWLFGSSSQLPLSRQAGSSWEASLNILFAVRLLREAQVGDSDPLFQQLRTQICELAVWLSDQGTPVDTGAVDYYAWEEVTWDTAVAVRAVLTALREFPDEFNEQKSELIRFRCVQAVTWMMRRCSDWRETVKYPFGPADVAQVVSTLIVISTEHPDVSSSVNRILDEEGAVARAIESLVDGLLCDACEAPFAPSQDPGERLQHCWWGDNFSTAEVIDALAQYADYACVEESDGEAIERSANAQVSVRRACSVFDLTQVDGQWGSHVETLRVTYGYLRAASLLNGVLARRTTKDAAMLRPEIHVLFKAIRWICDPKQIFDDRSFMHTMFLTVFYCDAMLEVYASWTPAQRPLLDVYDDVVWAAPMRATAERAERVSLAIDNDRLRCSEVKATATAENAAREIHRRKRLYHRLRMQVVIVSALLLVVLPMMSWAGIVRFKMPVDVLDWNGLRAWLISGIAASSALLSLSWFIIKRHDDDNDWKNEYARLRSKSD